MILMEVEWIAGTEALLHDRQRICSFRQEMTCDHWAKSISIFMETSSRNCSSDV